MRPPFVIANTEIAAGKRGVVEIPLSVLSNHTPMNLPVYVVHGRQEGPTLLVTAAVHGDEIIGVEIIRRILGSKSIRGISGTLVAVPIVNVYGFISNSRYTPDRRDLNRCFPGSPNGALASQLADVLVTQLLTQADYSIDLHSAAVHRANLPQIRGDLDREGFRELARAFSAPVIVHSTLRDGSLRATAREMGVEALLYEAGEALRFDETAIRVGVRGVIGVMRSLSMLKQRTPKGRSRPPVSARSTKWIRAEGGGILRTHKTLGDLVAKNELLGVISDPFGKGGTDVLSSIPGIVIGRTNLPIVNQGDALFHVAEVFDADKAEGRLGHLEQDLEDDPVLDDVEIV